MTGTGVVKGGVVVFENGLTLAEGTRVRVEELRAHATGSFWTAPTLRRVGRPRCERSR